MPNKFYINTVGGCGLCISLASFLTAAKKLHPDDEYNVCSPYFDIYMSCDAVSKVYQPNEIRDFIYDAKYVDGIIINQRLYDMDKFIKKQLTYQEAWAELLGYPKKEFAVTNDGMTIKSVLNPSKHYPFLAQQAEELKKQLNGKKFIITQFTGSQSPLTQVPVDQNGRADWSKVPYRNDPEPLKRKYDIGRANEFVDLFKLNHPDVEVISYQLPNEPAPTRSIKAVMPYLAYYLLAQDKDCIGTVSIDSSLQHLVAGITKSVVIWGHSINADNNNKIVANNFGYAYNRNIVQPCRRDDILYFSQLGPSGAKIEYITPSDLLIEVDNYLFNSSTSTDTNKETK